MEFLEAMASQTNSRKTSETALGPLFNHRLREGCFIVTVAISLFLLIALATYHHTDPGWSQVGLSSHVANAGGKAGAYFSDVLLYVFGYMAYVFPFMLIYAAWLFYKQRFLNEEGVEYRYHLLMLRSLGFVFVLATGCGLASLHIGNDSNVLPFTAGGILGNVVGFGMSKIFSGFGGSLILFAFFLTGVTLFTGLSWLKITDQTGRFALRMLDALHCQLLKISWRTLVPNLISKVNIKRETKPDIHRQEPVLKEEPIVKRDAMPVFSKPKSIEPSKRAQKERQEELFETPFEGTKPPLGLLDNPQLNTIKGYSNAELEKMSRDVEARLRDFNIDTKVVAVHPGPVITRFELQLAPGTKVSKISNLAKDLARSLSVVSVRVVEVIPGKSVIGLELPNEEREMVRLREVLSSQQYDNARSPLTLALGKDIAGHPVIVDLAKMPHLLVAGTTGSGKSIALNAMLLSLLYKSTPDKLRLILIDPKMLELSVYDGIPHLLTPVVTDMKDAANALRWCVVEMERRYKLMSSLGVRNISGYNSRIKEAEKRNTPLLDPLWQGNGEEDPPELQELPYIVVLADEYADMMIVVGKKIEELITRIAQKARAAGIHLILATQRPSVDVITGLIKANIPTRIAFQVSSRVDSRTILDQMGAEQLLGYGDMLYLPPGS